VVARRVDRLRRVREQLHTVGLDQQVDDECASGLSLAVQAVTAMREERIGRKPVANRSAGAATLTWDAHELLVEGMRRILDCTPSAQHIGHCTDGPSGESLTASD